MARRVFIAAVVLGVITVVDADAQFLVALQFPAADVRDTLEQSLGQDLILRARRAVDARDQAFGWDLEVTDRPLPRSPNFFDDCLCGHGPRLHDLYAWHLAHDYFPDERILPVYGYPYAVRVSCHACAVAGREGTDARVTDGTIAIEWRRLAASYPRQQPPPTSR